MSKKIEERIWDYVDKKGPDDCWLWTGQTHGKGYGCTVVRVSGKRKYLQAHREAWKAFNGIVDLPKDVYILHSCHNPLCCNPAHLRPGSQKDNMEDMIKAGRAADQKGESNPRARLSKKDVSYIRKERKSGRTLKSLAEEFGVHLATIGYAAQGKTWA